MNTRRTHFNWDHLNLLSSPVNRDFTSEASEASETTKYPSNYNLSGLSKSTRGNSALNRSRFKVSNFLSIQALGLNRINSRGYSTAKISLSPTLIHNKNDNLENFYVTGFCDADSSFTVSVLKKSNLRIGWTVLARLIITLHKKDVDILYRIQSCLGGVGTVTIRNNSDTVDFVVGSVGDLVNTVIPFFSKYPLITRKRADFMIFCKIVELINQKEHLTLEGIQKIVCLKASMNKGLTDPLKKAFPDITPIPRPEIDRSTCLINPWWLAGFIDGEGSFTVNVRKSTSHSNGYQVSLIFQISQHLDDAELMENLLNYFQVGKLTFRKEHPLVVYRVIKFSDIEEKLYLFLINIPLRV